MTKQDYERKEQAKQVNLLEFLNKEYPDMIEYEKNKGDWRVAGTNIKVTETSFYDFNTGKGGDNIRFLTDIMNIPFFRAIDELLKADVSDVDLEAIMYKEYERPENSYEDKKAYDYLKGRGIREDLIGACIKDGFIYTDKRSNIVFYNPTQEFCILRSTYADWKGIRTLTKNGYWEAENGEEKEVYIFESPIDALSYMTLYGASGTYVAMGGLKKGTVEEIVSDYRGYHYNLCVDWDAKGNQFAENFPEITRIKGTIGKDWNDELNI